MSGQQQVQPRYTDVGRIDNIVFWNPLPITNGMSDEARRLIRESDADLSAGRLQSALDNALTLNAIDPDYLPGFIRTSEILLATNRADRARKLTSTILKHEELKDRLDYELPLTKVWAHVNPGLDSLLLIATTALENHEPSLFEPYVPAAIDALIDSGQFDSARETASDWASKAPGNANALVYCARELLRAGESSEAESIVASLRGASTAKALWPEQCVAQAVIHIVHRGDENGWQFVSAACEQVRNKQVRYSSAISLVEFLATAVEDHGALTLLSGLLALNGGDVTEARGILQTIQPQDDYDRYLVSTGIARATAAIDDDAGTIVQALKDAFDATQREEVAALAADGRIFDPSATRRDIAIELIKHLNSREAHGEAIQVIEQLQDLGDDDPELGRLRAEILSKTGSRTEAVKQLDQLLKKQEAAQQHEAAIQTLESMVQFLPRNLSLRQRLVDKYLRFGQFNKAIDQLVMQARLLHRAERTQEAEPPIHRAIEIATMVNDWNRVEQLHKLLISFDPNDTATRHAAVATYVQYGQTENALAQLREIARIAQERGDPDEAIAALHQMLALAPEDPTTYHQLGELLVSIEEYGQAERVYRRLASLTPDDPSVNAKRSAISAMARDRQ